VRPPGGSWGAPATLSTELCFGGGGLVLGMDGSGNAIVAWVGSYADAADPAGTFVYADGGGNAFTFAAGATSFGAGGGSRGSLADLKIVPGHAVMLAAGAVSVEALS